MARIAVPLLEHPQTCCRLWLRRRVTVFAAPSSP